MASNIYPITVSPIKSIQRGVAASAGTVTISSVDINKSFVRSFSIGSAGVAAGVANTTGTYTPSGGAVGAPSGSLNQNGSFPTYSGTRTFSGPTSPPVAVFTAQKYGAYFSNSTTLTVTGACRWEVVEYI